jgi:hypothetical protein
MPDSGAAQFDLTGYYTKMSVPAMNPETGALEATLSYKAISAETYTQ